MKRFSTILVAAFVLAFCSITYELLLGQMLSAFLGNTVLRYSVTVALYMLSMGIGALLAEGRFEKKALETLLKIEIALTVIGGGSILLLSLLAGLGLATVLFSLGAHALIIIIGVLTGFEIPLLMYMYAHHDESAENIVLGIDYIGALFAAIIFAAYFYPRAGLVETAIIIGLLNAIAGLLLGTRQKKHTGLVVVQTGLAIVLFVALFNVEVLRDFVILQYLNA